MTLVAILRHLGEEYNQEHHDNNQSDGEVGGYEYVEVGILHRLELRIAQQGTIGAAHGVQSCLDEVHGHEHADDRAAGVETLCEVQAARGGLRLSHREDIGVTRCLEERQSAGHDEVGYEETAVEADALGREEQQKQLRKLMEDSSWG